MNERILWMINNCVSPGNSLSYYDLYDDYCNEFGHIPFETFKRYSRMAKQEYLQNKETDKQTEKVSTVIKRKKQTETEIDISLNSYDITDVAGLITYASIDTDIWECYSQKVNRWGNANNPNYQIDAKFRLKNKQQITPEQYAQRFEELLVKQKEFHKEKTFDYLDTGNLAELAFFDFHYGLYTSLEETGRYYDIQEANKLLNDCTDYFIYKTKNKVDKYLIPLGNDFFNSDTINNTTTKGTPQTENLRWQDTFMSAEELIITQINKLSKYAPVKILIIPGNHDMQRIFYLGRFLKAWYRDSRNVFVEAGAKTRKYERWGNTLIGYTHGNEEVKGSLPLLMIQEKPVDFAETKFREWHVGHLHHTEEKNYRVTYETHGIKHILFPSMIPVSDFIYRKGYLSVEEAFCNIYNYEHGKTEIHLFHP